MKKVVSRKLVVHSESLAVLRTVQLVAVGGGVIDAPPTAPRSALDHCVSAAGGGCVAR
jgi:hypothetical protein